MAKPGYFAQGIYEVKNTGKYIGKTLPKYRSSWELAFMRMCDQHPNILQWASEAIKIPYINPVSRRKVNYIPDFLIMYKTKSGKPRAEIVEIKPKAQTSLKEATSDREKVQAIVNKAKWQAAYDFCRSKGMGFRVLTQDQIFKNPNTRKKRK